MVLNPGLLTGLGQAALDPVAPGARRNGTDRHHRGDALLLCHHCFIMDVPGHADALIITDAAVNMLAKSLTFLAGADAAGIVLGARVPIILTSRADSLIARLASCAVATLVVNARRASGGKALG